MSEREPRDEDIFHVSGAMNFFSWLICEHPSVWQRIARLENSIVADDIGNTGVNAPIWVTGLARSGSTLLLEILARAPGVVSLTYKDFPPVFTPYAWNRLLDRMQSTQEAEPSERAHRDRILVTPDSPEAMEEPLWMSFFPDAHNPAVSNVIAAGADDNFAVFLDAHIRKLLTVRNGQRYLAKANYQITRMEYLLDLYPDARFVIPVRDPVAHVASLVKQHELFRRGQQANPRARRHLRRVGHFEFGLDRLPINTGDEQATREVTACWDAGREIEGWARYWAQVYGYAADRLDANPALAEAALVVNYTDLCASPRDELERLLGHCQLEMPADLLATLAAGISPPSYYEHGFSQAETELIELHTTTVLERAAEYGRRSQVLSG